ncbi:MAG: RimK family alpha-L-glutamate ligase [Ignavibacteria bacterium]
MKKIGILFGQENSFPQAFVDRVNKKSEKSSYDMSAEFVKIDKVIQGVPCDYDVIIDRISQDVPFYRGFLKNAALTGTAVINNPFWWSADEKFFNNSLATVVGVPVPKTVLLPSNRHPDDTNANSFRNLAFPLDWDTIFDYVGFPAYFKPFAGGGWKNVYKLNNPEEFFKAYNETGQLVMMLQEEIIFEEYFRCYCIDRRNVLIMPYEPRNTHHQRYTNDYSNLHETKVKHLEDIVLKINNALGYDFNTVELAIKDGIPFAIDFCNPAPDADVKSVGEKNFEWVVEAAANMAIHRAKDHIPGGNNLTWGNFVNSFVNNKSLK